VIDFGAAEAAKLNQIAFHLDLRCLARVPPTAVWCPQWSAPHRGIVAVAEASLKRRILDEAARLAKHGGDIVEIRGIGSVRVVTSKRVPPD
jgi:hypothetical protein